MAQHDHFPKMCQNIFSTVSSANTETSVQNFMLSTDSSVTKKHEQRTMPEFNNIKEQYNIPQQMRTNENKQKTNTDLMITQTISM